MHARFSGTYALQNPILPARLFTSLSFTGQSLLGIAPWLVLSVSFAAYAKASSADILIARAFTGSPVRMVALASLFGALAPFCSGGVAPVIAGLLGQTASAIVIGIPSYLNGYAALPLAHGLIELGMSPAVALAFLISGGITSIPAATAVWALVKPRIFALYIGMAICGSLVAAYAYHAVLALR